VFSADSVTPVYHYNLLKNLERSHPDFSPKLIFVFIGANKMNANGLHAVRECTFSNLLPLNDVWNFSAAKGEYLSFAQAILTRLLPVIGKRVPITHLALDSGGRHKCSDVAELSAGLQARPKARPGRNDFADANYFDIYRRSLYADYESSPIVAAALSELISTIKNRGATPILVLTPVTPEIRVLETELIGEAFDVTLQEIVERQGVRVLDLRDDAEYEFMDVNHLSPRGAHDLVLDHFRPLVWEILGE
jgi:hypothetical protein